MLNALNQDLYLIQYRIAIKKGEIIAGQELTMELDRLMNDLGNSRYYYDTTEAYKRIHFMEGCIRLKVTVLRKTYDFNVVAKSINRSCIQL